MKPLSWLRWLWLVPLVFAQACSGCSEEKANVCERGEHACDGQVLKICNDDLQGFSVDKVCATACVDPPVTNEAHHAFCEGAAGSAGMAGGGGSSSQGGSGGSAQAGSGGQGGSAGSAGSGGSSGSAGSAGSAGSGGQGGSAGSAGLGGSAGSGGASGSGGQGGAAGAAGAKVCTFGEDFFDSECVFSE